MLATVKIRQSDYNYKITFDVSRQTRWRVKGEGKGVLATVKIRQLDYNYMITFDVSRQTRWRVKGEGKGGASHCQDPTVRLLLQANH